MEREQLQELGFTKNEAEVYLALFDLGQCKVGQIIRRTGFHRNIIYRALDVLIAKKLVQRLTKRGVYYFETTSPEPLVEEIDRKKRLAQLLVRELSKKRTKAPSEIFVLSGMQGLQDLYRAVLDEGEDLYLIGANAVAFQRDRERFLKFDARRVEKNIQRWHLSIETTRGSEFNKLPKTQVKYLPSHFASPLVIWIFGQSIAHVLWEVPETIFLIHNVRLAQDYRKYFRLLWNSGTPEKST